MDPDKMGRNVGYLKKPCDRLKPGCDVKPNEHIGVYKEMMNPNINATTYTLVTLLVSQNSVREMFI